MAGYFDPQSMLQTGGNNLQIGGLQGGNAGLESQAGLLGIQQALQQQAIDTQSQQLDLYKKQQDENTFGNLQRQLKAVQAQSDINLNPTREQATKSKLTTEMSNDEIKQWTDRLTKQQTFDNMAIQDFQSGKANNLLQDPGYIKDVNDRRRAIDPNISSDHLLPEDSPSGAAAQLEKEGTRAMYNQSHIDMSIKHLQELENIRAGNQGKVEVAGIEGGARVKAAEIGADAMKTDSAYYGHLLQRIGNGETPSSGDAQNMLTYMSSKLSPEKNTALALQEIQIQQDDKMTPAQKAAAITQLRDSFMPGYKKYADIAGGGSRAPSRAPDAPPVTRNPNPQPVTGGSDAHLANMTPKEQAAMVNSNPAKTNSPVSFTIPKDADKMFDVDPSGGKNVQEAVEKFFASPQNQKMFGGNTSAAIQILVKNGILKPKGLNQD